ncbi:hypothetical protein ACP70R_003947 [Stipagrostis hirtigluma subsp. patula]
MRRRSSLHVAALRRGALLVPSLIHAYSSCGDLASACHLFDELPRHERTFSARTALASAFSAHGRCRETLDLFARQEEEAELDAQAATVLLVACARASMVEKGRRVFARVRQPALHHYTCMVEMLGPCCFPRAKCMGASMSRTGWPGSCDSMGLRENLPSD